ncbi:methyltransferase [Streptomyces sp.]|uniref:methyltransferase n=1 Tax=Streptomyces sp. TaxID=1931 RepID=UPI002D742385|nr:methyltransferase [Streptomyces sp.]HZF91867.1 methyltransferase [Streptomyces sp.]
MIITNVGSRSHDGGAHVHDPAAVRLVEITLGFWIGQAVGAFARLGIADAFAGRQRTADDLAARSDCDPQGLLRLLRSLTGVGVVREVSPGVFALDELGQHLRTDHPQSMRDLAVLQSEPWMWRVFEQLQHAVTTGAAPIKNVLGTDHYWTWLHGRPEARLVFDAGMVSVAKALQIPTALSYDYREVRRIVDVGGGLGQVLTAILTAHPHISGTLFDQPATVPDARRALADAGLAERCAVVGGDMFQAVPEGGDTYLLSFVLMDWDDERAVRLLRNVAAALPAYGRVLVLDCLVDRGTDASSSGHRFHMGRTVDLFQMCMGSARVRSRAEFEDLYADAGLRLHALHLPQAPVSLMEVTLA